MSSWVLDLLSKALEIWSDKFSEIWELLTTSPSTFKGGGTWNTILEIQGAMQAIGYALLVLFFVVGVMRSVTNFRDLKNPEQAFRLFIRFAIAKGVITYGMDLMLAIYDILQGVAQTVTKGAGADAFTNLSVPELIQTKVLSCNFLETIPLGIVAILCSLLIMALSFVMILTVYGRFFTLFIYTALSPIPLSTFGGEGSERIGWHFLKSYAGVCAQGAVIALACLIFTSFITTEPQVSDSSLSAVRLVWDYMGELIFDLLVLVGTVKTSEKVIHDMIGM